MAAAALTDTITDYPADADAQALALADSVDDELAGRYAYSVARNRASARSLRGEPRWDTTDAGIGLIDGVLWEAAGHDAEVYRATYRWELQLDPAADLEAKAAVIERARAALADTQDPPSDDEGRPSRDQLLEAMAAAGD